MSELVVVQCPTCSQKYRVPPSAVGRRGRCKKCHTMFLVQPDEPVNDDTVIAWITDSDPSSKSVMGSTGVFDRDEDDAAADAQASTAGPPMSLALVGIDGSGAHFEFPSAMLAREELRAAMPLKCIGCGAKAGLRVHLLHWPEVMSAHEAAHWRERAAVPVGPVDGFRTDLPLIRQLPRGRGLPEPFDLPFPVYACEYCIVPREVQAHVVKSPIGAVCRLTIGSLNLAVEFLRNAGGREAPGYRKLIEARDLSRDPWRALQPRVRHRIAKWYEPHAGEVFSGFFADADASPVEAGSAGLVLTQRRLIFKKHNACREYVLERNGRIEIVHKADCATVHVYEGTQAPAIVKLEAAAAVDLAGLLRKLHCRWGIFE